MIELKPCPFCGNYNPYSVMQKPVGCGEHFEIVCVECGASVKRTSRRKAIEAWNRRVSE